MFAAHEIAAVIDPDMATKMTVQFNLFGGTLLKLGTERHHHILDDIDSFDQVGCFGLTELAYGNNAVEMETTMTLDKETDEWIVNTPTVQAQKVRVFYFFYKMLEKWQKVVNYSVNI